MDGDGDQKLADNKPKKERPVWMVESTVEGAVSEKMDTVSHCADIVTAPMKF